jgi:hypothetical protein
MLLELCCCKQSKYKNNHVFDLGHSETKDLPVYIEVKSDDYSVIEAAIRQHKDVSDPIQMSMWTEKHLYCLDIVTGPEPITA